MYGSSEWGSTDDKHTHSLNTIPPQSIILLEDVDAAFGAKGAQVSKNETKYHQKNESKIIKKK